MEIPLFPLGTVLFPDGPLALRIFETRYLDMVSRCMRSDAPFGVVAIREGSEVGAAETFDVGTLARIADWRRGADGLLGLGVVGTSRFHVTERRRNADGLYVARVQILDPEPTVPLRAEHEPLADLARKLVPLSTAHRGMTTAYSDSSWIAFRLAELLPLPIGLKQSLLEAPDALARLASLRAALGGGSSGG